MTSARDPARLSATGQKFKARFPIAKKHQDPQCQLLEYRLTDYGDASVPQSMPLQSLFLRKHPFILGSQNFVLVLVSIAASLLAVDLSTAQAKAE
jgi:hypothetical protein